MLFMVVFLLCGNAGVLFPGSLSELPFGKYPRTEPEALAEALSMPCALLRCLLHRAMHFGIHAGWVAACWSPGCLHDKSLPLLFALGW